MGGQFDSTRTRVTPVFRALQQSTKPWLSKLLALPVGGSSDEWHRANLGALDSILFGEKERRIPAPPALLRWLVQNVSGPSRPIKSSVHGAAKREQLCSGEPRTISEALALIDAGRVHRGWHVLEGPTAPDVFIETADLIVVIEGKRTEAGPTTSTTWMSGRHQMWRHIDAAWEIRGTRRVAGMFIVESDRDGRVPTRWQLAATDTASNRALASSLPHRTTAERDELSRSFLGVTTWQRVVREFELPPSLLPDRDGAVTSGRVRAATIQDPEGT